MQNVLKDLVRCVNGFAFEAIKVTSDSTETKFEAVTADRTVILKAKAKDPVAALTGSFGLSNLSILTGILGLTAMKDGAVIVKNAADGTPEEFQFSGIGTESVYRLMADAAVPKQPNFKSPQTFDIDTTVSKGAFIDFKEQTSVFSSVSTTFTPYTKDLKLVFGIGESGAANHSSKFNFADVDAAAKLSLSYAYPVNDVLKALSLTNFGSGTLKISAKGVMVITIDTDILELSFIYPGRSN